MDWLTFLSNVVGSLAWPSALITLVIFLRKPIKELLPMLQRLKYKEFELEFSKRVEEVKDELHRELPSEFENNLLNDQNIIIKRLAEVSPRSAVLEAWRKVEKAALEAARSIGGESITPRTLTYQAIRLLEKNQSLDSNIMSLLRDLRSLRNEAAHAPDFALTSQAAIEYAASAAAVERYLKNLNSISYNENR